MSLKEAYKKKAEAELELAQARLVEFKAKTKSFTAETRLKYAEQVENLEHGVNATQIKIKELGAAGEDAWEHLKDSLESGLRSISTGVSDIADKLKG
ncbi:MAG: hypothetical protein HGB22_08150 [Chlorobiaceae bacterium]|nr:hypothetical protein [Chlorobiaceae bacterium]